MRELAEKLPINIHVKNAGKIGPRNKNKSKIGPGPTRPARVANKKVRFTLSTLLREWLARIKRYRASRKETGSALECENDAGRVSSLWQKICWKSNWAKQTIAINEECSNTYMQILIYYLKYIYLFYKLQIIVFPSKIFPFICTVC